MSLTWFATPLSPWGWIIGAITGFLINLLVLAWALRKGHLTKWATIAAFAMGLTLWMIEPMFFIILLTFFVSSSLLSKLHEREKKEAQEHAAKGSTRDVHQVLANGSAGFIMAMIYAISSFAALPSWILLSAAFSVIAAFAASNSDTWATEIGMLSGNKPRWILDLRKVVEPGTSGGVTRKGTLAAAAGALLVAGTGFLFSCIFRITSVIDPRCWLAFVMATSMAFLGSIVDSVLGATVQAAFKCQSCGKETEKRVHCSGPTILLHGTEWLDNDAVNFLASMFAAVVTFLIVSLIFYP
ncbi:MAG: DUF92 domain-containing protein [Candidatus Sigynarchaeota archaeon]